MKRRHFPFYMNRAHSFFAMLCSGLGNPSFQLIAVLIFSIGSTSTELIAQTKTWDGGAGSHAWHDADNWFPTGVPSALDFASIEADSVSATADVDIRNLEIINGQLFIDEGVDFVVDAGHVIDVAGVLLDETSLLHNQGSFVISESTQDGIVITGTSELQNGPTGEIVLTSCCIGGAVCAAITISGKSELLNDSSGSIYIDGARTFAVLADDLGAIHNRRFGEFLSDGGTVWVDRLINRGLFSIDSGSLEVFDSLANGEFGFLSISNSITVPSIFCRGPGINRGEINVRNGINGLQTGSGIFHNFGSISLDNMESRGFETASDLGVFENKKSGELMITNLTETHSIALSIYGATLINENIVLIETGAGDGIVLSQGGQIVNRDTVEIVGIDSTGIRGGPEHSQDSLFNHSTGNIKISNCGIPMDIDNYFDCQGTLEVDP